MRMKMYENEKIVISKVDLNCDGFLRNYLICTVKATGEDEEGIFPASELNHAIKFWNDRFKAE